MREGETLRSEKMLRTKRVVAGDGWWPAVVFQ
ncbi:uncharacterized protein G2W53_003686 [Senna tora]|uniref:Uncharacterized protein n=1 Tax=Senna tora TaxID=362788 RepID=A0A834X949_9FABA|nr:uncharacterized protein G2W53_003686 [Senna tora]